MASHAYCKAVHLFLTILLLFSQLPDRAKRPRTQFVDTQSKHGPLPETVEAAFARKPDTPVLPAGTGTDWWTAARADILRAEYYVTWQEKTNLADVPAAFQAPNRAQNLRTYFTAKGARLIPREFPSQTPPWQWGLSLVGYGNTGDIRPAAKALLSAKGNRIEYRRDGLTEWYINDERGLEQGFTLHRPPAPASAAASNSMAHGTIALELAIATNLTASLSAEAMGVDFMTESGAIALRYGQLNVVDATDRSLPAWMELPPAGPHDSFPLRLVIDASEAVYPITVDPLTSSPNWTAESDQASAYFGRSVATAGDVNGDGYSDVIVGAYYYDNGQVNEGRTFLFYGSAAGLSATANWTAESDQSSAYFGQSVATAGDVNGDGYSDVIVGAPYYDNGEGNEGRAFVYYGSAAGLSAAANWTAESNQTSALFGQSVATAGDVNNDGYSDVVIGAHFYDNGQTDEGRAFLFTGSGQGLSSTPNWTAEGDQAIAYFGASVSTAGDVNGDGYSDVIVGAANYSNGQTNEGRAFIYHGAANGLSTTASWTAESDQASAYFGVSVATAGDVNGDGYSDIIVGASHYDNGQTNEGAVFVYQGSSGGLPVTANWTVESNGANVRFGASVSTAGDVNGDGYGDVIVGAYLYEDNPPVSQSEGVREEAHGGRAFVYYGSAGGPLSTEYWTVGSAQAGAYFGLSVATAGDVNGDGYSDVIVGAAYYDGGQTDEGRAYAYYGSATGPSTVAAWTAEGDKVSAVFGYAVASAGDVNGDGYSDVIVGAATYDNGQTDEGRTFVYYGSAAGLSTVAGWTAEGDQVSAGFGYSVATAGDVNGDGYSDVIIGALGYSNGETSEGGAFVYYGSAEGLFAVANWIMESNQVFAKFGVSVATAGDVNNDGYSDVIIGAYFYDNGQTDEGRAFVYHGSATGLSTTSNWIAESNQASAYFGISVATAGDVNGDGFSDVIVGAENYDNGQADEGRTFVYFGSPLGLSSTANWAVESDQGSAFLGASVATAGDVNGDGYSDVIIGAPYYNNGQDNEGWAFVYHGSAGGLSTAANWTAESNQVDARLGESVATAGDVNGDGFSDVIVGAWLYDNGQTNEGRVFVFHGSASGLPAAADWTAESDQALADFGKVVSTAGDVNGDGYSDIIIGAPWYDRGQMDEGRVFLYYGNAGNGLSILPRQMRTDGSRPISLLGRSDSATSFQLRLTGRMPLGREDARLQWQVAPPGSSFNSPIAISGTSEWTDLRPGGTLLSHNVTGLNAATPYHWRARLLYRPGNPLGLPASRWFHSALNGWNEKDFRTSQMPLGAFNKTSPTNGATSTTTSPTLFWSPSEGAADYAYCYDTSNDNTCGGSWISAGYSVRAALTGLAHDTTYYWQVRAGNSEATIFANAGTWWGFTTNIAPPQDFSKSSPTNGGAGVATNPTLTWSTSPGAAFYEYCCDTSNDNACSSWVSTGAVTRATISGLSNDTTYYWQVRAANGGGRTYANTGAYWSFTTQGLPPAAFSKSAPPNAATGVAVNPSLSWGTSGGATSYEFCYDTTDDNDCSTWTSTGTHTSVGLSGLSYNTVYFWQVRAINAGGSRYANDSSTGFWSFRTQAEAQVCTFIVTPSSASASAAGGPSQISVATGATCSWSIINPASWISFPSPGPFTGPGTADFSVAANPNGTARNVIITIAGQPFTLSQEGAACHASLNPLSANVAAGVATGTVNISYPEGCAWQATSTTSWITISSGSTGTGSRYLTYAVDANYGAAIRTGTIVVGGVSIEGSLFTITQAGKVCTFGISPPNMTSMASGTSGKITVSAPQGCSWQASSDVAWISVTSVASGGGSGSVDYNVQVNTMDTPRIGTLSVAHRTFYVYQSGSTATPSCTVSATPTVIRSTGLAELTGELAIHCINVPQAGIPADIYVSLGANVTNRLLIEPDYTDALLLLNNPMSPTPGINAFLGVAAGYNILRWPNVILKGEADGKAGMRITNMRVNPTILSEASAISAVVGLQSRTVIPIANSNCVVATVSSPMVASRSVASYNPASSNQIGVFVTFKELFPSAFRYRTGGPARIDPAAEAGYSAEALGSDVGTATHGTRLYLRFTSIPAGVKVYAPIYPIGSQAAQLVSADASGTGGEFLPGSAMGGSHFLLTAVNSTVNATWEVRTADALVIEQHSLGMVFEGATGSEMDRILASLEASLAPFSATNTMSATGAIPRFRAVNPSVMKYVNLRILPQTTYVGTLRPLSKRALQLSAELSYVLSYTVVNEGSEAAKNLEIKGYAPPGFIYADCQAPGGVCNFIGTEASFTYAELGPGSEWTVEAQINSAEAPGNNTYVHNIMTVSSKELDYDLLNNTTSSGVVIQDCMPALSSSGISLPMGGGEGTVQVQSTCSQWWALTSNPWIEITSGHSGSGNGTVSISVEPNLTGSFRTGTLLIGNQAFLVSQAGPYPLPEAFSKIGPSDGIMGVSPNLTLTWGSSNGATGYESCFDISPNCSGLWASTGISTSAAWSNLIAGSTYYWQVRAINPGGVTYANNNVWWKFTTAAKIHFPLIIR